MKIPCIPDFSNYVPRNWSYLKNLNRWSARKQIVRRVQLCVSTFAGWIIRGTVFLCYGRDVWEKTNVEITTGLIYGKEPSHYSPEEFRIINQHLKDNIAPGDALDKLRKWKD